MRDTGPMTVERLSRLLYDLDVPWQLYRLDGSHFELAHVIASRGHRWIVFLSERGGESGPREFDDEDVACTYFLGRVMTDLAERGRLRVVESDDAPPT
jgi:hypothetical protein